MSWTGGGVVHAAYKKVFGKSASNFGPNTFNISILEIISSIKTHFIGKVHTNSPTFAGRAVPI